MIYLLRQLLLTILLFSITVLNGQQEKINWGPQLEGNGIVTLIGEEGDFIYAYRIKNALSSKMYLLKIDKSTLEIVEETICGPRKRGLYPIHMTVINGKLHMLMNKKKEIFTTIYDLNYNEESSQVFTEMAKKGSLTILRDEDERTFELGDESSIIESRDKSKVAIKITTPEKKKIKEIYHVFDIQEGYTHLYSTEIILDKKVTLEKVIKSEIDSIGAMSLLIKHYNNKKGKETKKKRPDYRFSVQRISLDGSSESIDLPRQQHFWKDPKLIKNEDGSIVVAAMTQKKHKKGANGYQIIKFGNDNKIVFDKFHSIKDNEGEAILDKNFRIKKFIGLNNNLSIIVSEYQDVNNDYDRDGNLTLASINKTYTTKDVILDGFDENGHHVFTERIYKNTREFGVYKLYSCLLLNYDSDGLSIWYNRKADNTGILNNKDQNIRRKSYTDNEIIHSYLSVNGKMTFKKESSGNNYSLSGSKAKLYGDKIYVLGSKGYFKYKFAIGVIQL